MKIAYLIHQFLPYGIGGSEVYTYELVQEQSKNHQVVVFSAWRNSELAEYSLHEDLLDGIPVIRLVNNYKNIQSFQEGYDNPQIDEVFGKWIQSFKPDVVHIHHLSNLSFGIVRLLKRLKIPMVMTLHDFWMVCPRGQRLRPTMERCDEIDLVRCTKCIQPWLSGWAYPLEEHENHIKERYHQALEVLDLIDLLIAPSLFIKREFISLGLSPARIVFMDYGRDIKRFENFSRTPNGNKRFGYIGTLIPSKGIHVLLEAWRYFRDEEVTLQIHGVELPYDGWEGYGEKLKELSQKDPRISWKGAYNPEALPKILSTIDVLVVPSIWDENSPLIIQEAQLTRTPVLASRIGGVPERVVPYKNGFLFRAGDPEDLSRGLEYCLSRDHLVNQTDPSDFFTVTPMHKHASQLESWYRFCHFSIQ